MDSNADREPDYALWHMAPSGEQFDVWTTVKMTAPAGQVLMYSEGRFEEMLVKSKMDRPFFQNMFSQSYEKNKYHRNRLNES